MRAVQGALIVASSIQIILGYSQIWAICSRFFRPLGMVPVIALVVLECLIEASLWLDDSHVAPIYCLLSGVTIVQTSNPLC